MYLAIATYPIANNVRMIVAKRKPAGAPRPLPKPTAIGVLLVIAVIGAALATAMNKTATMPIAPFFRPAGADPVSPGLCAGAESVVIRDSPVRIGVQGARIVAVPAVSVTLLAPFDHSNREKVRQLSARESAGRSRFDGELRSARSSCGNRQAFRLRLFLRGA